jgi:uncharacterized SAM-binding protein YcdF (DUF218 family)
MKPSVRNLLASLVAIGVILLVIAAGVMQAWAEGDPAGAAEAEFAVVLGAKVNGSTPSRALRARLDKTLEFMQSNPDAPVIVCGGQGPDEEMTEAQAMYDYLAANGADMSRVYCEDQSSTTRENLLNAQAILRSMGGEGTRVCIISSEFHLCRAAYIASTLGMDASTLGSRTTPWPYKFFYTLREVPAFVKAMVQAG